MLLVIIAIILKGIKYLEGISHGNISLRIGHPIYLSRFTELYILCIISEAVFWCPDCYSNVIIITDKRPPLSALADIFCHIERCKLFESVHGNNDLHNL